jgi:hypothetical protein
MPADKPSVGQIVMFCVGAISVAAIVFVIIWGILVGIDHGRETAERRMSECLRVGGTWIANDSGQACVRPPG